MKRFPADRRGLAILDEQIAVTEPKPPNAAPRAGRSAAGRRWGVFASRQGWHVRHDVRAQSNRGPALS